MKKVKGQANAKERMVYFISVEHRRDKGRPLGGVLLLLVSPSLLLGKLLVELALEKDATIVGGDGFGVGGGGRVDDVAPRRHEGLARVALGAGAASVHL